jgi:hypothetical protein
LQEKSDLVKSLEYHWQVADWPVRCELNA